MKSKKIQNQILKKGKKIQVISQKIIILMLVLVFILPIITPVISTVEAASINFSQTFQIVNGDNLNTFKAGYTRKFSFIYIHKNGNGGIMRPDWQGQVKGTIKYTPNIERVTNISNNNSTYNDAGVASNKIYNVALNEKEPWKYTVTNVEYIVDSGPQYKISGPILTSMTDLNYTNKYISLKIPDSKIIYNYEIKKKTNSTTAISGYSNTNNAGGTGWTDGMDGGSSSGGSSFGGSSSGGSSSGGSSSGGSSRPRTTTVTPKPYTEPEYCYNVNNHNLCMGYNDNYKGTKNPIVYIPSKIDGYTQTAIGDEAFKNDTFIQSIWFADTIKTIGYGTFFKCTNLNYLDLNKVEKIQDWAFFECTSLTNVIIPATVTYIGEGAFSGCTNLKTVTFLGDKNKITMGANAFPESINKDDITAGETIPVETSWSNEEFETAVNEENKTIALLKYVGSSNEVTIPNVITKTESGVTTRYTVKEIGRNCFNGRAGVTKISFANDTEISKIGDFAFRGCSSLTSIDIPNSVTTLGAGAFHSCTSLKDVTLGINIESIPKWVFAYCTNLETVLLRDVHTIKSIGPLAFYQCSNLKTMRYIRNFAIGGEEISNKEIIFIPEQVSTIEDKTFYGCTSIKEVVLPGKYSTYTEVEGTKYVSGVNNIKNSAFRDTTNLESIKFYEAEISSQPTVHASSYKYLENKDIKLDEIGSLAFHSSGIKQFGNEENKILIPQVYSKNNITKATCIYGEDATTEIEECMLGNYVFAYCRNIENVEIVNNEALTFIPYLTFYNCTGLKSIDIPESVTQISQRAFMNCNNLETVNIKASSMIIGQEAFENCSSLNSIKYGTNTENGTNITKIYKMAFYNCSSLEKMDLKKVTDIEYQAFANSGLKIVNIINNNTEDSIINLQEGCFKDCNALHTVIYSTNKLKEIPDFCFSGCSNLKTIGPNDGHTEGGWNLSNNDSITTIGKNAFDGCSNLNKIYLSDKITSIGEEAFANCEIITQADIRCKDVSKGMFKNCIGLEYVTFNGTENIRESAFENCIILDEVILPSSLKYIETGTFIGCSNLNNIILKTVSFKTVNYIDFEIENAKPDVDEDELLKKYEYADAEDNIGTIDNIFEFTDNLVIYMNTDNANTNDKNNIIDNIKSVSYLEYSEDTNKKEITIKNAKINDEDVKLLNKIENSIITVIGENAFKDNMFSKIQLPIRISTVKTGVFEGCVCLENIEFTQYLTSIEDRAFANCGQLESITVSPYTEFNAYAFDECRNLKDIKIVDTDDNTKAYQEKIKNQNGVIYNNTGDNLIIYPAKREGTNYKVILGTTEIGKGAFRYTSNLNNVEIPNTVTDIRQQAFVESGISKIEMPSSITNAEDTAFKSCKNLSSIKFSEGMTTINESTFENCEGLSKIIIPSNIKTIKEKAFANCENLETVLLPKTVLTVNKKAFENDENTTIYTTTYIKKNAEEEDVNATCFYAGTEESNVSKDGYLLKENNNLANILKVHEVVFDDEIDKFTETIEAKNPRTNKTYGEGEEFTIKITTKEEIKETEKIPTINIDLVEDGTTKPTGFNGGKAQFVEKIINEDGTTTWVYRYVVQDGDNGKIKLSCPDNSEIEDLLGNKAKLKDIIENFTSNDIIDTLSPILTIKANKTNPTNSEKITYTFEFNKEVFEFDENDITVNNGRKGTLSNVTKNTDGTYSYTMEITAGVAEGNEGELQVIVNEGVCKDIKGYKNYRAEHTITVDRRAPILIGIEGYAKKPYKVKNEVESVKEKYNAGEVIDIVATFTENVTGTAPTLNLQFSESGEAKGTVSAGTISGNKVTYTYTITEGDNGTLSIKGFSGTLTDKTGNEVTITKRTLDGDTIIADTKPATLDSIKVIAPDFKYDGLLEDPEDVKRYGKDNTITIITEYSENIYGLNDSTVKELTTIPTLKLQFSESGEAKGTISTGIVTGNKVTYTYNITDGDKGDISIKSIDGIVYDIAGNKTTVKTLPSTIKYYEENDENIVEKITADTKSATMKITKVKAIAYDKNGNEISGNIKDNKNYYRDGSIITFKLISENEYIYDNNENNLSKVSKEVANNKLPTITFGNKTANGEFIKEETNVEYLNNQTIITYTYKIASGDNGEMKISLDEDKYCDISLNNNEKVNNDNEISKIVADTIYPVTNWQSWIESEGYGIIDNENGTWTVTFSEKIYAYDDNAHKILGDVTSENAPKLLITSDNETALETNINNITTKDDKTVITYIYTPYTKNMGAYGMKLAGVSDIAGNLFNYKDQTAPEFKNIKVTNPETTNSYKAGTEVTIVATFSEKLSGIAPTLKIKVGNDERTVGQGTIEGNTITYKYTIVNGDNGLITLASFSGNGLQDLVGNVWINNTNNLVLEGSKITADTRAPKLQITVDELNNDLDVINTNKYEVTYRFKWDEKVEDFTEDDIEVINGLKEKFTKVNDLEYTLTVSTMNDGRQIIRVMDNACHDVAGNVNTERTTFNKINIDNTKPMLRATINGGDFVVGTDTNKSTLREKIVINEELSSLQYVWTTKADLNYIAPSEWKTETKSGSDVTFEKDVELPTLEDGTKQEEITYYLFIKAVDLAGNEITARTNEFVVHNSEITLVPNTTELTNENVTVTVGYGEGLTENRRAGISGLTQSADSSKVIVTENGTVYAEATDELGNKVYKTLVIDNIDKTPAEGRITYTTNADKTVTATITFNEENVTITNNEGKATYTFTENGEFTFRFKDSVGNIGEATAKVTSIEKKTPEQPEEPEQPTVDTIPPTIISAVPTGRDINIAAVDIGSGIAERGYGYSTSKDVEPTIWTTNPITVEKDGTYYIWVKDKEENKAVYGTAIVVDTSKPCITFTDKTDISIKKDGETTYLIVQPTLTTNDIKNKIDKAALKGKDVIFSNLTGNNTLKTGTVLKLNDTSVDISYVIVVLGDINCDGKITFSEDVLRANNYRLGIISLEKINQLAADVTCDGKMDFSEDILRINNYRLGIIRKFN